MDTFFLVLFGLFPMQKYVRQAINNLCYTSHLRLDKCAILFGLSIWCYEEKINLTLFFTKKILISLCFYEGKMFSLCCYEDNIYLVCAIMKEIFISMC